MAEWVVLGVEVMKEARQEQGLSMEAAARLLHISSKTYERREKDGRWPRHDVLQLGEVLGLEIEAPNQRRPPLRLSDGEGDAVEARLRAVISEFADGEAARHEEVVERLDRLAEQLRIIAADRGRQRE